MKINLILSLSLLPRIETSAAFSDNRICFTKLLPHAQYVLACFIILSLIRSCNLEQQQIQVQDTESTVLHGLGHFYTMLSPEAKKSFSIALCVHTDMV